MSGRRRRLATAGWLTAGVLAVAFTPVLAVQPEGVERVSVRSDGAEGDGSSRRAAVSADGRYVAFQSDATNLVPGDTNGMRDVFVHDRATGATTRVSVHSDGTQGNGESLAPAISADGRYVAFESAATTLVAGDTNGVRDVFVHNRETGVTRRVSLASDGGQANGHSARPSISADGRYVAFESAATNLVAGDTNGVRDVFVRDGATATTTRVSVASDGGQGNGTSVFPAISADGRYAAFGSNASNLVPGDTNTATDVFVRDRETGTTTRVSVRSDGAQGDGSSSLPALSSDGRLVAFWSEATNLVPGDTGGAADVFVHDRSTGATERVSVASDGAQANDDSDVPSISGDGRLVAFHSLATNLVNGDTNGSYDVFVHDWAAGATERVSVAGNGSQAVGESFSPALSADGRTVAFESSAPNLVPADTNAATDVFAVELSAAPLVDVVIVGGSGAVSDDIAGGLAALAPGADVSRRSGPNRFSTAAAVSEASFSPGVAKVYIATGGNFPDALSAGPAAALDGAPILLVGDTIPDATAAELARLAPIGQIVILGGTAAVSAQIEAALTAYTTGDVVRRSGANRFSTAAAVSEASFAPGVNAVYIATGGNFPDALTAGPPAALDGAPILLVGDLIPDATAAELARLAPIGQIVILGGTAAVSAEIEAALAAYTTGDVVRRSGANRFATAAAVSAASFSPGVAAVYVATGGNFPDGLTAGPAAAMDSAPILLVGDDIPDATAAEIIRLGGG